MQGLKDHLFVAFFLFSTTSYARQKQNTRTTRLLSSIGIPTF